MLDGCENLDENNTIHCKENKLPEYGAIYKETINNIITRIDKLDCDVLNTNIANKFIKEKTACDISEIISTVRSRIVDKICKKFIYDVQPVDSSYKSIDLRRFARFKRFSKKVTEILQDSFRIDHYPSDFEKMRLASICFITPKQVTNWFTNKRSRVKMLKSLNKHTNMNS